MEPSEAMIKSAFLILTLASGLAAEPITFLNGKYVVEVPFAKRADKAVGSTYWGHTPSGTFFLEVYPKDDGDAGFSKFKNWVGALTLPYSSTKNKVEVLEEASDEVDFSYWHIVLKLSFVMQGQDVTRHVRASHQQKDGRVVRAYVIDMTSVPPAVYPGPLK